MRRGAKPAKAKVEAKPAVARKARKSEGSRVHDLEKLRAEAQKREAQAQEQQTATAEILRVIASSPTDVLPTFEAIATAATRLCAAQDSGVIRFDGALMHLVANDGFTAEEREVIRAQFPRPANRGMVTGRAIVTRAVEHVADITRDPEYDAIGLQRGRFMRAVLSVPMLHNGQPVGAITVTRREAQPFTASQIALLETFARQAVIAIENVRLFNETKEALDQQTATAEILRVIASSPTDLQPVFDTIVRTAVKLCAATFGGLQRIAGSRMTLDAQCGVSADELAILQRDVFPLPISRESATGRAVVDRAVVHIRDIREDPEFGMHRLQTMQGFRTILAVPMLCERVPIGALALWRREVQPFSAAEISLVQTFADQAVIAIENVRLFKELEARNRDLTEALEQQTATSEILRVIASSPTDLDPVLEAVARNAAQLCRAEDVAIIRAEEDGHTILYSLGPDVTQRGRKLPPARTATNRAIREVRTVHVPDLLADPDIEVRPEFQRFGWRTGLAVPLVREGAALGTITARRSEVRPFSDQEIKLLETFADQAVIAIENVRLFKELQASNRDLTEALDTQTATSDILRVISRSQADVQPVFDTIAASAVRLCRALFSVVSRRKGDLIYVAAQNNLGPAALEEIRRSYPLPMNNESIAGRTMVDRTVFHVRDVETDPDVPGRGRELARAFGFRTVVSVPMLREGEAIGAIVVARADVEPFSEQEIGLLQTFADQAVIAVENVRLFKELQARTGELTQSVEQLTALGEVSRAVSSTLDVETVLDTIVSHATQLAGADGCAISEYDDATAMFHVRATHGIDAALVGTLRARPLRKGEGVMGRATETREPIQIADIAVPGAYESHLREVLLGAGFRALLSVPLLREEEIIGSLSLSRKAPGEYSPEVIDVLKTFATQSALAIQNARLFREIADKSRQLEAASRHKSEFLANMSHELRTPLNAIIGFSEVLTERMFGELNEKQDEYLKDIYASGQHLLSLINDILDLSKIEAGRMELEVSDFDLPSAIDNALILVRERASRRGITLGHKVDERLGQIRGDERKVKQVLLNLLSNALKFTPEGGRIDVTASVQDGAAEIAVADTGVGIAPEDQEAVFEEFRQVGTADKKVEGTGLGLALARKFIELHGGRIWVKSQVGQGSTFTFTLPVRRED